MLGSLARKLRAAGVDTAYYKSGGDDGILALARMEGRVIITSDRRLAEHAGRLQLKAVLLQGDTDYQRVVELADSASSASIHLAAGDPLCSLCGARLDPVSRVEVVGKIPPGVIERHRKFFRCAGCGKHYWGGSHWKKLRRFRRLLPSELPATKRRA